MNFTGLLTQAQLFCLNAEFKYLFYGDFLITFPMVIYIVFWISIVWQLILKRPIIVDAVQIVVGSNR